MQKKIFVTLLMLIHCTMSIHARAALRKTPKVYNALITTDDNLTSSRAFPVIQPTIHETGIPHYPFGPYTAFGYYSPNVVRFGQPIAPGLAPREQLPYPLPNIQFPPQLMSHAPPIAPKKQQPTYQTFPTAPYRTFSPPQNFNNEPQEPPTTIEITQDIEQSTEPAPKDSQQPVIPPKENRDETQISKYMPIEENQPQEMSNDKLPIALNEFGLPPSLIPLQQYPTTRDGNTQLPPYVFNQYPLLPGFYDPLTGFRDQYLPPYEYTAGAAQMYALASAVAAQSRQQAIQASNAALKTNEKSSTETENVTSETQASFPAESPNFESIKNASKYQNSKVPDVPPPPIPSGAKTKSSS